MKYLTKADILRIRASEIGDFKFNYALPDDYVSKLSPDAKLNVFWSTIHLHQGAGPCKNVMRVQIDVPDNGKANDKEWHIATLDMPIEHYNALPETELLDFRK